MLPRMKRSDLTDEQEAGSYFISPDLKDFDMKQISRCFIRAVSCEQE